MPLELGIFIGAKAFDAEEHTRKAAMVLDTDRYRYQKYISDIAGQDIRAHRRKPADAIRQVRSFLATHCDDGVILPGGDKIAERYGQFRGDLTDACTQLHVSPGELTFSRSQYADGGVAEEPSTLMN